jgi:metal-responsive CopG/Arc/MetJ family transcriptional regulator
MPPKRIPAYERLNVTFRLPRGMIEQLDRIAKQEVHSRSQMLEIAVRDLIASRSVQAEAA